MSANERFRLVVSLARDLTSRRDLDDVLAATLRGLHRLIDFSGGSIQLLDEDGYIRLGASDPQASEDVRSLRVPIGASIAGRILLTEQPVFIPDVLADPQVAVNHPNQVSSGVRSYFGVPLIAEGSAIGLLQIDAPRPDAWPEDERLLVLSIAPLVAAAIQNARAHMLQREAEQRLRDIEIRHSEVERIVNDHLRGEAAHLARDAAAAVTLAEEHESMAVLPPLRSIHESALDLAETVAGLAYVVHAQRQPIPDLLDFVPTPPLVEPVRPSYGGIG